VITTQSQEMQVLTNADYTPTQTHTSNLKFMDYFKDILYTENSK
jgi:hypothetical protein